MQRPWATWSRRRFSLTMLPAVAALIGARIVLLRAIESQTVEIVIQGAVILMSAVVLYVAYTWAAEYDRQNPRDYTK